MYCKLAEQVIDKNRLTDEQYIKLIENKLHNISARINTFVSKFENDIESCEGANLKIIYLEHKDLLTHYPR